MHRFFKKLTYLRTFLKMGKGGGGQFYNAWLLIEHISPALLNKTKKAQRATKKQHFCSHIIKEHFLFWYKKKKKRAQQKKDILACRCPKLACEGEISHIMNSARYLKSAHLGTVQYKSHHLRTEQAVNANGVTYLTNSKPPSLRYTCLILQP